jgi:VanZ family protein
MKRLSQVLAWVLVFGIVGLSIVPPHYRVITDLPRPFEHLSIFLLAGLAFGLGYPDRYPLQSIALVLFAAAVELVQVWVPGRHPRLSDFAAGVLGLGLGIGLAYVSTRRARGRKEWRASVRLSAVDDLERQVPGLKKSWIRW